MSKIGKSVGQATDQRVSPEVLEVALACCWAAGLQGLKC